MIQGVTQLLSPAQTAWLAGGLLSGFAATATWAVKAVFQKLEAHSALTEKIFVTLQVQNTNHLSHVEAESLVHTQLLREIASNTAYLTGRLDSQ